MKSLFLASDLTTISENNDLLINLLTSYFLILFNLYKYITSIQKTKIIAAELKK